MFEIGRVCKKTAGSEKGKVCVVIGKGDGNFVLIDGNVRRRRCNIAHLKPLEVVLKIKEKANTSEVKNAMRKAGIEIEEKVKLKERLRKARELKKEKQVEEEIKKEEKRVERKAKTKKQKKKAKEK